MNLIIFPKYSDKGASSRYRIYNYLSFYKQNGITVEVYPLFDDWYIQNLYEKKSKFKILFKLISAYARRIYSLINVERNAIIYIGAELLPYFPAFIELYLRLRGIKFIVEFDDAIFHNYNLNKKWIVRKLLGHKTSKVIKWADTVITGSSYLTNYANRFNTKVVEIPTSIDIKLYKPCDSESGSNLFIIGWIGSLTTSQNIKIIIPALKRLGRTINYQLNLIGFDQNLVHELKDINYKMINWSAKNEIEELKKIHVGIMPLYDTPFNRGKCAFKLIQYMACGKPTISTPLAANMNVDINNQNLFALNDDEWYSSFYEIYQEQNYFKQVGINNYKLAGKFYSVQENHKQYIKVFKKILKQK